MNKDLTVGKPGSVLVKFCLPLFGSVIFQQLYNIADSLVAGKYVGEDALAAVGNSYEITFVFLAFAFGCNIGCSVVTSRLFGSGKLRDLKSAVYTSLISVGAVCAVLMLLGLLLCRPLLEWINTPAGVFEDSLTYLRIYVYGLPFVFFYNIATGIFSALGDSRTPFIFLACSSLSNIGVDVLFVAKFGMGVRGVALATFLCQGVSCLLALVFVLIRLSKIKTAERAPLFSVPLFREFLKVAIPSILQQSCISVGNIVVQGVINVFGEPVMAGYAAAIKLNNMVIAGLATMGNGASNFAGQNYGAGKPKRIKEGFRSGLLLAGGICLVLSTLYFVFAENLIAFFIENPTAEAIDTGKLFLRIVTPFFCVIAVKLVTDGILRGVGNMRAFMIATFTDLIVRVALAIVLAKTPLGILGVWLSWPIGWLLGAGVSVFFYGREKYEDRVPSPISQT